VGTVLPTAPDGELNLEASPRDARIKNRRVPTRKYFRSRGRALPWAVTVYDS
jgi:hypothetical protein